jgi:transcriptional regulator with PAS, ATPase and Fis domain
MKQTPSSLRNRAWLGQFDSALLLSNLLDFSRGLSIYIVDKEQQVLYWGQGMETLTGLPQEKVLGKPCLKECVIDAAKYDAGQVITLTRADGNQVELTRNVHILFDRSGEFAGGMGLLTQVSEALPNAVLPNESRVSKQNFHGILSRSPAMRDVFHIIQNAAETEATVLVRGESGSGKELVANAIHKLSSRQSQPFLAINCAALSGNLLESELFGHVRGAFTGAIKDHSGLFQRANGGTLFLDEVAEMPLELQAKLLRVLQERNYIPVGGNHSIDVDVRIVAATHRSLREEVKNGHFREDLMYRLRVVPIFLPPLRERREDIGLLIWHYIAQHNDKRVRVIEKIDPDAMKVLLDYRWPGNVRELHNVVEYAFAVGRGPTLRLSELPPEFREPRHTELAKPVYRLTPKLNADDEKSAIKQALEQCLGRAGEAANLLGMSRATFWRKRKLYEL